MTLRRKASLLATSWFYRLTRLSRQTHGNVIVIFGLLAPVMLIALTGSIDYARWLSSAADLQVATDTAALAGARELRLASGNAQAVIASAKNRALAALGPMAGDAVVDARIEGRGVVVTIDVTSKSLFGDLAPTKFTHLHAQATAQTASVPTCLIALGSSGNGLDLQTGLVTAKDCAAYSNSKKTHGLQVIDGKLVTALNCSSGGVMVTGVAIPPPVTDCPVLTDPLASRPPPTFGMCDHKNLIIAEGSVTLSPGVYCGGLTVKNGAKASLTPGVYVVADGALSVSGDAILEGNGVGFYLRGDKSVLALGLLSTINLVAPKDGPLAGILFFEDPAAKPGRQHVLGSRHAPQLLGTLYFPHGDLTIGKADAPIDQASAEAVGCLTLLVISTCVPQQADIGALSAWTIVIAREIHVNFRVNLVLNSNYSATSVSPPPEFDFKGAALTK